MTLTKAATLCILNHGALRLRWQSELPLILTEAVNERWPAIWIWVWQLTLKLVA